MSSIFHPATLVAIGVTDAIAYLAGGGTMRVKIGPVDLKIHMRRPRH